MIKNFISLTLHYKYIKNRLRIKIMKKKNRKIRKLKLDLKNMIIKMTIIKKL